MDNDYFEKKMIGVKPIKNKENILIKKKNINKSEQLFKNKSPTTINKTDNTISKKINSNFNISYGEINRNLKRGKIKVDRRLDLHGYGLLEAHEKFKNEVIKLYNNNKRCLLVITGKGSHTSFRKDKVFEEVRPRLFNGKIKNSIISWIHDESLKHYILTHQKPGNEYGGDGAIYVYLRKKKA